MNRSRGVTEDDFATLKIHRNVKKDFARAVEDYYGKTWGHLSEEAETAIRNRTEELHVLIEARNGVSK